MLAEQQQHMAGLLRHLSAFTVVCLEQGQSEKYHRAYLTALRQSEAKWEQQHVDMRPHQCNVLVTDVKEINAN